MSAAIVGVTNHSVEATETRSMPTACSVGAVAPPGRTEVTFVSEGFDRGYVMYVPANLDRSQPAPLVVDFPAYSLGRLGEQFSGFSLPDALGLVKADAVGAVVVTTVPVNGAGGLLT